MYDIVVRNANTRKFNHPVDIGISDGLIKEISRDIPSKEILKLTLQTNL